MSVRTFSTRAVGLRPSPILVLLLFLCVTSIFARQTQVNSDDVVLTASKTEPQGEGEPSVVLPPTSIKTRKVKTSKAIPEKDQVSKPANVLFLLGRTGGGGGTICSPCSCATNCQQCLTACRCHHCPNCNSCTTQPPCTTCQPPTQPPCTVNCHTPTQPPCTNCQPTCPNNCVCSDGTSYFCCDPYGQCNSGGGGTTGGGGGTTGGGGGTTGNSEPTRTGGSVCLHGNGNVVLKSGATKLVRDIQLGDEVAVGQGKFSPVFMFTHRDPHFEAVFSLIRVSTTGLSNSDSFADLKVTTTHFVHAKRGLLEAGRITTDDELLLANGKWSQVINISTFIDRGVFNPQTLHGDIVVDGVRVSTFTSTVNMNTAHSLLAPLRAAYRTCGAHLSSLF